MAGSKSDYLENEVLDHILGRTATTVFTGALATVYIALWNSTITDAWTPLATGECAGSTYARAAVTNSSASWTNSTAGTKHNKVTITFTTSAGADWGTIKAFSICDTASTSAGNMLYWGDLASNQTINTGNTVQFSTGSIVVTES